MTEPNQLQVILHKIATRCPDSIFGESSKRCLEIPGSEVQFINELRSQIGDNRGLAVSLFGKDVVEMVERVKG